MKTEPDGIPEIKRGIPCFADFTADDWLIYQQRVIEYISRLDRKLFSVQETANLLLWPLHSFFVLAHEENPSAMRLPLGLKKSGEIYFYGVSIIHYVYWLREKWKRP